MTTVSMHSMDGTVSAGPAAGTALWSVSGLRLSGQGPVESMLTTSMLTARGSGKRPAARVVVLGAGFAGLSAAMALDEAPVEVTLVDRNNYNTFQPLLYQVATAGLNPGDIAYPARSFVRDHPRCDFRQGEVAGVDWEGRQVLMDDGGSLPYDFLVIATGATTNFFGVPGAARHSFAIYTLDDALAVRNHIFSNTERAYAVGEKPGALTVVVVGGGPTGVEMAGALAELHSMFVAHTYPRMDASRARVVLVEMQDRLLGAFERQLGLFALDALRDRGVEVRLGETVKEVTETQVTLGSGETVSCGLVIWAAGVTVNGIAAGLGLEMTRGGRIAVGVDLRVPGRPEVFVAGDVAGAGSGDGLMPQLAQPAIQEGKHAARQIARLLQGKATRPFRYRDKGTMATIGRRAAVAELPGHIHLSGTPAWLAWLGLHIVTLLGFRNRVSVLVNWAWRYLLWRRGPRPIVGG